MVIPLKYVYLVALVLPAIIWLSIFLKRKDLRKEMVIMGIIVGLMSVATSYFWWTVDWWRPITITGTRVGIEDLLSGFFTGGIMSTGYEILFRRRFLGEGDLSYATSRILLILLLLAIVTRWLFRGVGLTSFLSGMLAMALAAVIMFSMRKDLLLNGLISGLFMVAVSIPSYSLINLVSPEWMNLTYLSGLSGIKIFSVPIEEFIFWFTAGFIFGPFYKYWKGKELRFVRV